jgi:hypothetical protein
MELFAHHTFLHTLSTRVGAIMVVAMLITTFVKLQKGSKS